MKVTLAKIIVKTPQKYIVPRRYTSHTRCRVFVDDVKAGNDVPVCHYGTFRKTVKYLRQFFIKKYGDVEFEIRQDPWTIYQDY